MTVEYWIEYYDIDRRNRYFTSYYTSEKEAEQKVKSLETQGYIDVELHEFRY